MNGSKILLFKDGQFIRQNMLKSAISKNEIKESLRLETKQTTFDNIEMIYMEVNGRLSFIEKKSGG